MLLDNFESLRYFWPESILSIAVLLIITIDLVAGRPNRMRSAILTLLGVGGALAATLTTAGHAPRGLFGGLIAHDPLATFFKIFFLVTTAIIGLAAVRARDAIDYTDGDKESAEFYTLVLTTTLGMF